MNMSQSTANRARCAYLALLSALSVLGGCAFQGGAVALSAPDDETAVARSALAIGSYSNEYTWERDEPSKRMLPTSKGVCFLTGVHGTFRGTSETVKVSNVGGFWYLTGFSHQPGVGATARCFPYDPSKVVATQLAESTARGDLDLGAHAMCGLSRVSGAFGSAKDAVHVYRADSGHWFLQTSASSGEVDGGAICLDDDPATPVSVSQAAHVRAGEALIVAGNLTPKGGGPTEPLTGPVCFLTRIAGDFSRGASAATYVAAAAGTWNYYLQAASAESEVATSGVCIN